jgi:hypothetical protein
MGSERGYDVGAVAGAPIPVLGDERGTKVRLCGPFHQRLADNHDFYSTFIAQSEWCGCLDRCGRSG